MFHTADSQTHIAIIKDLALAVGCPVDLIDLDRTHNPLLWQILTKGRRVLCHDRTRYAELILRMVYEKKRTSCPTTAAFYLRDDKQGRLFGEKPVCYKYEQASRQSGEDEYGA